MNRRVAILELQKLASTVPIGEDHRFVCPLCEGGSTREKSLSLRRLRDIEASFCCYRASCGLGKGFIGLYSDGEVILQSKHKPITKPIEYEVYPLSVEGADLLRNEYHLDDLLIRYGRIRHIHDKRLYIPIFSPNYKVRGAVLRRENSIYTGRKDINSLPKAWIMRRDEDQPCVSWYRKGRNKKKASDTLVVVEDCLSALKCVPYSDAVALNGVSIPANAVQEIRRHRYGDILIALDNDATKRSFRLVEKHRALLPQTRVMPLGRDIKNMTREELQQLMEINNVRN